MKKLLLTLLFATQVFGQYPDAVEVLQKIDKNMSAKSQVVVSTMGDSRAAQQQVIYCKIMDRRN